MLLHRSPALTAIYNEIKNSDRNRILDLGPMNKGCFDLFSDLSCRIRVEDLRSLIVANLSEAKSATPFSISECFGDYRVSDKFDVVLAWDLFNYLELKQIESLFEALRPFCKTNTLLYMLRYVETNIPPVPRKFGVKDKYLLEVSEAQLLPRVCCKHSTLQLLSAMPMCFMQDTVIGHMGMLPGITEHVLRFEASDESKHLMSRSEANRASPVRTEQSSTLSKRHSSPSITELMSLMQSADDICVLDLASPTNRSEDSIVECAGTYFRADLFALIQRSRDKSQDELNLSVFNHGLSRTFDVILAWDLLNFCSPAQLIQLDSALSALSHENTFLLSLMYTGKSRPTLPSKFEVKSGTCVDITRRRQTQLVEDGISGATLLHLLNAYNLDQTFAYRGGMDREIIEYIFVHAETAPTTTIDKVI